MSSGRRAFTLIELLVVIAIVALLVSILLPALGSAREQAKMLREYAAARMLYIGYSEYSTEQRGLLLPGQVAKYPSPLTMLDDRGTSVTQPAWQRWPWRLRSSMGCGVDGSLLVNEQSAAFANRNTTLWSYGVSLTPSLGLNFGALGGDESGAYNLPGYLKRIDQSMRPSWQMVFISGRFASGSANTWGATHGYFNMIAPTKPSTYSASGWSKSAYSEGGDPTAWGNIHPRWGANKQHIGGQAVVMHLDGHVEGLTIEQMRDMTRWSDRAAREGNPEWDPAKDTAAK